MKDWFKKNWMIILGVLLVISGITAIASDTAAALLTLALGILFLFLYFRKQRQIKMQPKVKRFDVVGLYYYRDALEQIRKENSDWNKTAAQIFEKRGRNAVKVYHYKYPALNVDLRPEPDNEHDHNAVAVYVDNYVIGHIAREDCSEVQTILNKHKVDSISGSITGGEHKQFYTDGSFSVEDSENGNLRASVTIHYV